VFWYPAFSAIQVVQQQSTHARDASEQQDLYKKIINRLTDFPEGRFGDPSWVALREQDFALVVLVASHAPQFIKKLLRPCLDHQYRLTT